MIAVIKTYCHLNAPVRMATVMSRDLCKNRSVLIANNSITSLAGKLSCSSMKSTLQLNSCWLHTFGQVYRSNTVRSSKLSVPLTGKYTQYCPSGCHVSVAMALGLLLGWTVLELQQHMVSCAAEAAETNEYHDNKEPIKHQTCQIASLEEAILESDQLLQRVKLETNTPGLVVAVTVDGKEVWTKGELHHVGRTCPSAVVTQFPILTGVVPKQYDDVIIGNCSELQTRRVASSVQFTLPGQAQQLSCISVAGYGVTDVENLVDCKPASVMRIASISKPMTMVAIARLWEQGKLDLDKPVQHYVPSWPEKVFKGKKVTITTRHLVSMMGGIRHYDKLCRKQADVKKEKQQKKSDKGEKSKDENRPAKKSEFEHEEYYIKKHYSSVTAALDLFKDDELCSLPGTEFLYSTHAWTLLSAVVEGASGRKFTELMHDIFRDLGLENTYFDEDRPIIPYRSRYYVMDKQKQRLVNAPYVDNSYKWAGGGFLSTVHDVCHFGNALLYSYQWTPQTGRSAGFLRPDTMQMMWSPVPGARCPWDTDAIYAMGWCVVLPTVHAGFSRDQRMYVSHTGGAVGASSVLLILPRAAGDVASEGTEKSIPRGVCVSMIANKQSVGLSRAALKVAKLFDCVQ